MVAADPDIVHVIASPDADGWLSAVRYIGGRLFVLYPDELWRPVLLGDRLPHYRGAGALASVLKPAMRTLAEQRSTSVKLDLDHVPDRACRCEVFERLVAA